jgi:hypothetical protein
MLFSKTVYVYCQNDRTPTSLWGNAEFFNVQCGDTFHHMTLRKTSVNTEVVLACLLSQACSQLHNFKTP